MTAIIPGLNARREKKNVPNFQNHQEKFLDSSSLDGLGSPDPLLNHSPWPMGSGVLWLTRSDSCAYPGSGSNVNSLKPNGLRIERDNFLPGGKKKKWVVFPNEGWNESWADKKQNNKASSTITSSHKYYDWLGKTSWPRVSFCPAHVTSCSLALSAFLRQSPPATDTQVNGCTCLHPRCNNSRTTGKS